MPLPEDFVTPTRQEIIDQHERDVRIRQPSAKVGQGSLARIDGANIADHLLPIYANSVRAYHNSTTKDADQAGLEEKAEAKGLPKLLPASGANGFVQISAVAGGVFISAGKIIKHDTTGLQFKCSAGRTYGTSTDDLAVPIVGIDTGPSTNLAAGTVLRWENPPPGLGELATVLADSNGKGLTGGRNEESVEDLRKRVTDAEADPPAAGNSADVRKAVKAAADALGIPIQEVFVYSTAGGPNTYAVVFTLRPARAGGSRAPSAVQIAAVRAYITGELSHGDGIFLCTVLESDVDVMFRIKWAQNAVGWADLTPYPLYNATEAKVSAVTSATAFQVTSVDTPQVGQTIAFYNAAADPPVFVRKKILTVTGAGPYDLTIDTAFGASDIVYTPAVNEPFCPWSDSLDLLLTPTFEAFDELGPGEQFASFFDAGLRQKRNPEPPVWGNELTHRVTNGAEELAAIGNIVVLEPTLPYVTPVGTPKVSSNLLTLGRLLAFP